MLQQFNINQLLTEVNAYNEIKRDFIAPSPLARVEDDGRTLTLKRDSEGVVDHMTAPMTDNFMRQVCTWADLPLKYLDTMQQRGRGELVARNLNSWLDNVGKRGSENRLFRGYDGMLNCEDELRQFRSFHSDKYRVFDNFDLLDGINPVLQRLNDEVGGIKIESCGLTDKRMYLKIVFPQIEGEVAKGDIVKSGVVISNSETGQGAISVKPLIFRLVCLNGMVLPDRGTRSTHLGKASQEGEMVYEGDTMDALHKALKLQLRDHVAECADTAVFENSLQRMRALASSDEAVDPDATLEKVAKKYVLTEVETKSAKKSLWGSGDFTAWGFLNAVTNVANDHSNYDRASDLERIGGRILDLRTTEWNELAQAA